MLDEAEAGDGVARTIVETVAGRMGDYARVCASRTGQLGAPFPLVLCGGVLRHPSPLLRSVLLSRIPDGQPLYPDVDPVAGAVLIAADRVGARPDLAQLRAPFAAASEPGADVGGIRLDGATKVYPNGVKALDDVTLDIRDGEFMVLVGPSGCGKSTLLRMIAGLEEVTEGRIVIGDRDVTDLRPRDRDIAMVFQNYALYPHMTVEENLGFGLKLRRVPRSERASRVREVAATLGLLTLLDRRPALLSGGQRQRVAMGRAMVREPTAFLMDEPLSNLDAKLRVSMRAELARLHDRLGVTTVYVTHDQVEAMTLGQRVAVLRDGVLQQCDTPQRLFHDPTNLFVAAFIGSPSMNVVEATVGDGSVGVRRPQPAAGARGAARAGRARRDPRDPPDRPPSRLDAPAGEPRIVVRPDLVEELGGVTNVLFPIEAPRVQTDATRAAIEAASDDDATLLADDRRARFCASIDGRRRVVPGEDLELAVDHRHLHFFDPATGEAISRRSCGGGVSPRAAPSRSSVSRSTAPPTPVGVVTARPA